MVPNSKCLPGCCEILTYVTLELISNSIYEK